MHAYDEAPGPEFCEAASRALTYLQRRIGMSLWTVARRHDDDYEVLFALDSRDGTSAGDVLTWQTPGNVPLLRRDPQAVTHLAAASLSLTSSAGNEIPVGAFLSVPLLAADGHPVGMLFAVDRDPQAYDFSHELPLVEMVAHLLSAVLHGSVAAGQKTPQRHLRIA